MIVASIPLIIAAIAGIVLFTNVDEVISESIEIDTSSLNYITNTWAIDSICDVYLAKNVEFTKPNPSQWYLDNFSEEQTKFWDDAESGNWLDDSYRTSIFNDYYEALDKKTSPDLRDRILVTGNFPKEKAQEDSQCYKILSEKYPNMME